MPTPVQVPGRPWLALPGAAGDKLCVDDCQLLSRMPGLQQLEAEVVICVLTWKGRHPLIPCRAAEKQAPSFFPRSLTTPYSSYYEQMQNPLSPECRKPHSRSRGKTALQDSQLPGKMLGRWQLQPDGIASLALKGTMGQCLQCGSALAHPRLSCQHQPRSSLACQAHAFLWHGAALPAICVVKQQHQEGLEKYSESGGKEGRERKPQLSTA